MNEENNNAIELPTIEFDVEIGIRSIIYLSLAIILSAVVVIMIARYTKQ